MNDWQLFDQVEPIGTREQRYQLANIAAILANAYRPPSSKSVDADTFLLKVEQPQDEQARNRRMFDTLRAIAKPVKGRKGRKKKRRPKT